MNKCPWVNVAVFHSLINSESIDTWITQIRGGNPEKINFIEILLKLEISLVFVFRPKFLPIATWNSILTQTSKSMLRKLQLDIWNLTWIAVGREFENFVQIEHGYRPRIYFEFESYRFWSFDTMTLPIKCAKGRQVICLLCFDKDTNARRINENSDF